ncbi:MAG: hypothetical protein JRN15_05465 [Nitrososphaerota archaeon]|nr:hypothetical protein [Nitrososphaerota archaeon]
MESSVEGYTIIFSRERFNVTRQWRLGLTAFIREWRLLNIVGSASSVSTTVLGL